MTTDPAAVRPCPLCRTPTPEGVLAEVRWYPPRLLHRIRQRHPQWHPHAGACPGCVQNFLLRMLHDQGNQAAFETLQEIWPLDAEAAFGAIPTPLRLQADPRFSG